MRALRTGAFAARVVFVAIVWAGAELVYFIRLGYAHVSLRLPYIGREIMARSERGLSGVDLRPLAKQAAIVAVFAGAGFGAAAVVGPVLKNDGTRLAALPPQPEPAATLIEDTQAVVASLDAAVPLPMPRIAHRPAPRPARNAAAAGPLARSSLAIDGLDALPSRLMLPADQARGRSIDRSATAEVQVRLLRLVYEAGAPTGRLSDRTRRAIAQFQSDAGLPVTAAIDSRTVEQLRRVSTGEQQLAGDGF